MKSCLPGCFIMAYLGCICQWTRSGWECPKEELKEIEKRKGDIRARMMGAKEEFLLAKEVVGTDKESKNGLKILQLSGKTPASPGQCRNIMAQIGVDAFHGEGVVFIMDIEDVLISQNLSFGHSRSGLLHSASF